MIDGSTTQVFVRVNLASRRVVAVSDMALADKPGQPVFTVAANSPRVDYYIVEDGPAPYNVAVRIATAGEQAAADAALTAIRDAALAKAKYSKSFKIKDLYDETFIRRFRTKNFFTTTETIAAAGYTGADAAASAKKADAVAVMDSYDEWRWNNAQTAIDAMLAATDLGAELDDEYKAAMEDALDTFLTAKGWDITIYHR